jgi:hypothetical protein
LEPDAFILDAEIGIENMHLKYLKDRFTRIRIGTIWSGRESGRLGRNMQDFLACESRQREYRNSCAPKMKMEAAP